MVWDSYFLLTLGFLLTILGGMLIRNRSKFLSRPPDQQRARSLLALLAETLSFWTMNAAALVLVFAPDLLSELALCIWLLIAAMMYWYAAWTKLDEPAAE